MSEERTPYIKDDDRATLRVEITGNRPQGGNTTVAGVILNALSLAMPNARVCAHTLDGDLHHAVDAIANEHTLDKITADIVVVDHNSIFVDPRMQQTGRVYVVPKELDEHGFPKYKTVTTNASGPLLTSIMTQLGCDEATARIFWGKLLMWADEPEVAVAPLAPLAPV